MTMTMTTRTIMGITTITPDIALNLGPGAATDAAVSAAGLFDLLSWMSPAWPVGAYTHSGGLEWAVEERFITDAPSCQGWIADLLGQGPLWSDLVLFAHAFHAARAGDGIALLAVAELAHAAATGAERRLETCAQGEAFRRIAGAAASAEAFVLLDDVPEDELAYPVACACLMAQADLPLEPALAAFAHGAVANLVSAAQRLVPLGQTHAQQVLRALKPQVLVQAARAAALDPNEDPFAQMGSASLMAELGCMAHETQYTRLFRT
ncbi:urease accessory protein UreF [Novosphingobium sp. 9]|uniref:urease accessory protein UreF n=1 Tax=Novosphingobium sp. 9 TaxID=2025349 RepID=UPI0021B60E7D|nr:urease accessory UreF family protein [Novosphingobium sp. 9]